MENTKFAMDAKGMRLMIIGLLVIIAGLVLLSGGGIEDPEVFNYEMFNFQRLVAAPIVLLCGIIVEITAIMKPIRKKSDK